MLIANNSGIFFCLASLLHNHQENPNAHAKLRVLRTPHWLDDIDNRHESLPWGQTIYALPWYVRDLAKELFPQTYKDNTKLTWGEYKAIKSKAESLLKEKLKDRFYVGNINITRDPSSFKNFNLFLDGDKTKAVDNFSVNTYFYNWSNIPITELKLTGNDNIPSATGDLPWN